MTNKFNVNIKKNPDKSNNDDKTPLIIILLYFKRINLTYYPYLL